MLVGNKSKSIDMHILLHRYGALLKVNLSLTIGAYFTASLDSC